MGEKLLEKQLKIMEKTGGSQENSIGTKSFDEYSFTFREKDGLGAIDEKNSSEEKTTQKNNARNRELSEKNQKKINAEKSDRKSKRISNEKSAGKSSEKNSEKSAEKSAKKTVEKSSEKNEEKKVEKSSEKKAEKNAEKNIEKNIEKNVEKNVGKNSKKNLENFMKIDEKNSMNKFEEMRKNSKKITDQIPHRIFEKILPETSKEILETPAVISIPLDSIEALNVVLIIDNREIKNQDDRNYIHQNLLSNGLDCELGSLPLGDFLWIARIKGHL